MAESFSVGLRGRMVRTSRRMSGVGMKIIGVTGGIGAGKSAVLKWIEEHYNCTVVYADTVAKRLQRPGTACSDRLVEALGQETVDRLQELMFRDPAIKQTVESIVHPAVKEWIEHDIEAASRRRLDYYFLEAALLIECGYRDIVDEMWYIYAPTDVRVKRLMGSRGYTRERAEGIVESQLSDEEYRAGSDVTIDNGGKLEDTYAQVAARLAPASGVIH